MPRNWTDNQRKAIFANDGSVLVSAAAGSGKTAVLVQKIIELITNSENPVDVDRLLVVTFTRAAASEMKERVMLAIDSLLEENPCDVNLLRQRQLIYKANISTIDSFCIDIAREYFYNLDIKQDFRIADNNELVVLENDAMEATLDYFYENGGDEFKNLVNSFSSPRDDKVLIDVISRVYVFLRSHPFPEKWLEDKLSMYNADGRVSDSVWGKEIIKYAVSAVEYCQKICLAGNITIQETDGLSSGSVPALFLDYKSFLDKLSVRLKEGSWDDISKLILNFTNGKLVFPKKFDDEVIKNQIKNCRDNIKSTIDSLKKLFAWNEQQCKEDISRLAPLVNTLFKCVTYYSEKIEELKLDKNIADFSDIEHYMIKLFVRDYSSDKIPVLTDIAGEVSKRFDYIMVDECQDVNEVQDLIFRSISRNESNLFMVGDVKQSIYGFRQAMPEIFLSRKNAYSLYDEEKNSYPAKIILDKNFRSRKGVANGINFIFSRLMSEEVGDMEYSGEEMLNPAASFPEKDDLEINLTLIDRDSYDSQIDFTVLEARYIATQIQKMVLSKYQITENGSQRAVQYRDFAILLRSASKTSETYVNELMAMGVPAYSETKGSFFDSREIKVMLNFLRVLDNPVQDIPLLSVMMSPIYGFSADDMAEIKCTEKHSNLYSAVSSSAEYNSKSKHFLEEISKLRTFAITHSVEDLVREIYEVTGYPSIISAVEPRPNAVKNLNLLCEYAAQYELGGYKGLSAFIHYLDKMKDCNCDFEAGSLVNGEITNTVKVMSIHSSKGLEFPVCFLGATSKKFNRTDLNSDVLLHSDLGIGVKKRENLCRFTTMPREGVALNIAKSQMSEELRVLYVALTRAKEKLFVVSSQKNPQGYLEKLSSKISVGGEIPPYAVKNAGSISDWIFMCGLVNPYNKELSNMVGMDVIYKAPVPEYESLWGITYVDKSLCNLEEYSGIFPAEIFTNETLLQEEPPEDFIKELDKRINFQYKYAPLVNLPTKVSASDIAHREQKGIFSKILQKPAFLSDKSLTAVQKGTAFHKFLQYCSFEKAKENPEAEKEHLKSLNLLSSVQADSISNEEIENFMQGGLAKRILCSKEVFREFQFMSYINADEYDESIENDFSGEKILLQGAVDLAFEENGELVIVDYKTDRVKDILRLKETYSKQLALYKNAMEQCTDYKVKECIIYSLYLGEYITI